VRTETSYSGLQLRCPLPIKSRNVSHKEAAPLTHYPAACAIEILSILLSAQCSIQAHTSRP
jgi:hypothetical protein